MAESMDPKLANIIELPEEPPQLCKDTDSSSDGESSDDDAPRKIADDSGKKSVTGAVKKEPVKENRMPTPRASVAEIIEKSCELSSSKLETETGDEFLKYVDQCALTDPAANKRKEEQKVFKQLLKEGSALLAQTLAKKAADKYVEALAMLTDRKPQELGVEPFQVSVVKYALARALIDSRFYENIVKAIELLTEIEYDSLSRLPAIYYALGLAYLKLNRLHKVEEISKKGLELLKKAYFVETVPWPGSGTAIEETDATNLQDGLTKLLQQSRSVYTPDAICRYSKCLLVSTHIIPSCNIYLSDPDFHGYVETLCSARCRLQYHVQCWKVYKKDASEVKITDRDFLGRPCATPDCKSSVVVKIEIYNEKGVPKSHYVLDQEKIKNNIEQDKIKHTKVKNRTLKKMENSIKTKTEVRKKKKEGEKSKDENQISEKLLKVVGTKKQKTNDWNGNDDNAVESRTSYASSKDLMEVIRKLRREEDVSVDVQDQDLENLLQPLQSHNCSTDIGSYVAICQIKKYLTVGNGDDDDDAKLKNSTEFINSYFYEYLKHSGPISIAELNNKWEKDKHDILLEDALQSAVPVTHGILDFLLQSLRFACIDDYVCIASDVEKAYEKVWPSLVQQHYKFLHGKARVDDAQFAESSVGQSRRQIPPPKNEVVPKKRPNFKKEESSSEEYESETSSESDDDSSEEENSSEQEVQSVAKVLESLTNNVDDGRGANVIKESGGDFSVPHKISNGNVDPPPEMSYARDAFAHRKSDAHVFEAFSARQGQNSFWPSEVVLSSSHSSIQLDTNVMNGVGECESDSVFASSCPERNYYHGDASAKKQEETGDTSSILVKRYEESVLMCSKLKVDNFSLQEKLDVEQKRHNQQMQKLEQERAELFEHNRILEEKVRQKDQMLDETRSRLTFDLQNLAAENENKAKMCLQLHEKVQEKEKELEENKKQVRKLQKEVSNQKVIFDVLKEQIRNTEEQVLNMKGEHAEMQFSQLIETCVNNIGRMSAAVYFLSDNTVPRRSEMENGIRDWNNALVNLQRTRDKYLAQISAHLAAVGQNTALADLPDIPLGVPALPPCPLEKLLEQLLKERRLGPTVRTSTPPANVSNAKPAPLQMETNRPNVRSGPSPALLTFFGNARPTSVVENGAAGGRAFVPPPAQSASSSAPQSTAKLTKYAKLMHDLQNRFASKTSAELTECVRLVRLKHNNKLSGMSFEKIESEVEAILKEKGGDHATKMGLDLFKQSGAWGIQANQNKVNWSGKDEDDVECVICCDDQVQDSITKLPCNHGFHTECIRKWLREQSSCPSCRVHATMPDEYPPLA